MRRISGGVMHCNVLQHTATLYNALQHTATYCNTLQYTAIHCNIHYNIIATHTATKLQITYTHIQRSTLSVKSVLHCNALQCTATHCIALKRTALHCNTLQCNAAHLQQTHTREKWRTNLREKWRKWISLTGSPCWPSASANHRQTG